MSCPSLLWSFSTTSQLEASCSSWSDHTHSLPRHINCPQIQLVETFAVRACICVYVCASWSAAAATATRVNELRLESRLIGFLRLKKSKAAECVFLWGTVTCAGKFNLENGPLTHFGSRSSVNPQANWIRWHEKRFDNLMALHGQLLAFGFSGLSASNRLWRQGNRFWTTCHAKIRQCYSLS